MDKSWIDLAPGDKFRHGDYFKLEVRTLQDGVYPFLETGKATMVIPWRPLEGYEIEVCLLEQVRADAAGSVFKVCGGYKKEDEAYTESAERHLQLKLGLAPSGSHPIVWWRECLGCGPQYRFPIQYGFLREPTVTGEPENGFRPLWMPLKQALLFLSSRTDARLFDDFSLAHMAILSARWKEL